MQLDTHIRATVYLLISFLYFIYYICLNDKIVTNSLTYLATYFAYKKHAYIHYAIKITNLYMIPLCLLISIAPLIRIFKYLYAFRILACLNFH
ncbi:hypothetical protein M140OLGA_1578 [Staphylococcus aureus subsp. aureus 112808A]|nr:hypothetical protein M140OLGA_1578 [Staphylococcus aureus subsp. aureus 112808A]